MAVPAKKWVWSAVKVIDVTDPITLDWVLMFMLTVSIFAIQPSPAPTSKSPFWRIERMLIPYWKRPLAGPILL